MVFGCQLGLGFKVFAVKMFLKNHQKGHDIKYQIHSVKGHDIKCSN
jgi:hypothetical protein